jgi:hypothetical protein
MPSSIFELTSDLAVLNIKASQKTITAAGNEATTLTAAQCVEGVVTMTPSTGRAVTTPTGAELKTYFGGQLEIGTSFEVTVVNAAAATHAITLTAAASGITLGGAAAMATIAAASSGTYVFVCTAVGTPAFTVYRKNS